MVLGERYTRIAMIKKPEMIEGAAAFRRFRDGMKAVLVVPRSEIQKRIEEHRALAAKNPNRRGPKPKPR
jgi:hypothetical protein